MLRPRPRSTNALLTILTACALVLLGAGCSADSEVNDLLGPQTYGGRYAGGTATGDTDEGAAFARWVMQQDPAHQYITGAVVRGDQTLGVKVQPNVTRGDVQQLLVSLTEAMARTFPGQSVRTIAFYHSGDKLAEAYSEPRSGRVEVGFAR